MKSFYYFGIILLVSITGFAQKKMELNSPNGDLFFSVVIKNSKITYRVSFKGNDLVKNASLNLVYMPIDSAFRNFEPGSPAFKNGIEEYELIVGKVKKVSEPYKEMIVPIREKAALKREIQLQVRAFNDGIAFRYLLPKQDNWHSFTLAEEQSEFTPVGNPTIRALFLPGFTTSHEGLYSSLRFSNVVEDTLIDLPALFEFDNNTYMAVTEAALDDFPGMYLVKSKSKLVSSLSPTPSNKLVKAVGLLPHKTPWRVLMISDRVGALIESNILTNLNEPSAIKDVSWIKPGKTTWTWWNGNITPDTTFSPGNNFETHKYYIDFCAKNGIEYHSVVEYGNHEWYVSDGQNFYPGENVDAAKPVPGLDMQKICDYAAEKGVGIRVWVHWKALYPQVEKIFSQYEKWGIKGLMVDFMDRDDQEMVNIQTSILKIAATHKLHIQFHGSYKPTGMHRTYPNEFTREGALNYEYSKWSNLPNPSHNVDIAYTRLLAGSTDYHLGGFRSVTPEKFKVQYTRPLVQGTRCHMMALYVVYENYIGMISDYPDAYKDQPGFDFLTSVPVVWDETKVVGGKPGEWIGIARRKGKDWYVGIINNDVGKNVELDFGFLGNGNFKLYSYSDNDKTIENPNELSFEEKIVQNPTKSSIRLIAGGGLVFKIVKL